MIKIRPVEHTESHLEFYRRWNALSRPYIQWQLEQFLPYMGHRIADVGCGLGNFTSLLRDRDFYLGIDHDPELLADLMNNYGSPKVHTANLDITKPEFATALRDYSIDTTLCVNVIEHIEDDRLAVDNLIAPLPSGGHLCLLVPAMPWLFGTLDVLDAHYRRYTKSSLSRLFANKSGRLVKIYYLNSIAVFPYFIKGRILREKTQANSNYHVMNAILPFVKIIENAIKPPFGLSVVAIWEKA